MHLEHLGSLKAIAFDKTGTLTSGKPVVTEFIVRENADVEKTLALVSSIEAQSNHPLAVAIVKYAEEQGVTQKVNLQIEVCPGIRHPGIYRFRWCPRSWYPIFMENEFDRRIYEGIVEKLSNEGKTVSSLTESLL